MCGRVVNPTNLINIVLFYLKIEDVNKRRCLKGEQADTRLLVDKSILARRGHNKHRNCRLQGDWNETRDIYLD